MMRKKTVTILLAGSLALGLGVGVLAQPVATAAPVAEQVGSLTPGDLARIGGLEGFAQLNSAAITAGGWDATGLATAATAAQSQALTIDPAAGTVAVAPATGCAGSTEVGYVVAETTGHFSIALSSFSLSAANHPGALGFTDADAIALLPPITFTIDSPSYDDIATYTMNLKEWTITPAPGLADLDTVMQENKDEILGKIRDSVATPMKEGLDQGLSEAMDKLTFTGVSFERDLPITFAYAYRDTLASGQTATIQVAEAVKGTWLDGFDAEEEIGAETPIKDMTWRDFVPAAVDDALTGTVGESFLDDVDITEVAWESMEPDLEQKLPGLLDVAAGQMADGIGAAMKELHDVKAFPDLDPEAVVTLQRCNKTDPETGEPVCALTVAEKKGINTALQALADSKIKGSWQDSLIENGDVTSGLIERSVTFDGIDRLTATGLASTTYGTTLVVAGVEVDAGQTAQLVPQPAGPDVAVTYSYETSDASVATVDSTGKVTGVGAGTATITVRATFGCSLQDPLIQVGQATVTVNAEAPTPKQCSASTYGETLTVAGVSVTPGSTAQLAPQATGPAGVTPTYTYASDDQSVATVDASGLVTGVGAGDAKITVRATYTCGPDDSLVQVGEATATVGCDFSCALRDVLGQVRLLITRLLAIFASIGA